MSRYIWVSNDVGSWYGLNVVFCESTKQDSIFKYMSFYPLSPVLVRQAIAMYTE